MKGTFWNLTHEECILKIFINSIGKICGNENKYRLRFTEKTIQKDSKSIN